MRKRRNMIHQEACAIRTDSFVGAIKEATDAVNIRGFKTGAAAFQTVRATADRATTSWGRWCV